MISAAEHPKRQVLVHGKPMSYVELGQGDPVVFLHGNPTSSYLWRNIMPLVRDRGRLIAPDLLGMGDSAKLEDSGPQSYRFAEHRRHFDALLETLEIERRVVLVVHDWGSALGFDWARRHPDAVRGIAHMEAILRPIAWDDFPAPVRPLFQAFRSPAGEEMILENNIFVEEVLPGAVMRALGDAEMTVYRRPFLEAGEARRPTLTWPRQLPIDGEPRDVVEIVESYAAWLRSSQVPKLFVNAEPGALVTGATRDFARSLPNQTEVTVPGVHFIQEDSPEAIGQALADWLDDLD